MSLRLDWCSHEAAKYACEHWHYSRRLSAGRNVYIGVWEDERFIGVVVFGMGSGESTNGTAYGLKRTHEVAELTRVALTTHRSPVSRILAIAIRMIRRQSPGLRLLVSFADEGQGHHGGIYQAGGWIFTGDYVATGKYFVVNGQTEHGRTLGSRYGRGGQSLAWLRAHVDPKSDYAPAYPKHRYLMPLDDDMRRRIAPLAKPYPKRAPSADGGTPVPPGGGGSTPTGALQIS